MQPVFQQNSQRRSVRHAELLAVRARVSSQRPFLTGGGFLVLVISCGRDAAKLFPQFPGTGCFLPLAVSYRRPFPVAGRFLGLAHHPEHPSGADLLFHGSGPFSMKFTSFISVIITAFLPNFHALASRSLTVKGEADHCR